LRIDWLHRVCDIIFKDSSFIPCCLNNYHQAITLEIPHLFLLVIFISYALSCPARAPVSYTTHTGPRQVLCGCFCNFRPLRCSFAIRQLFFYFYSCFFPSPLQRKSGTVRGSQRCDLILFSRLQVYSFLQNTSRKFYFTTPYVTFEHIRSFSTRAWFAWYFPHFCTTVWRKW
jgi:hypothetical protein